ncbi:uncharacterized threonine-rich GPI-anchored glycoprotein PJ4664.02 isoform X1 [Scomber scombrus]|uniref:Uncharacterized threonine-rich GPI-anchored glycoprotein PJ4664.02 isoform X1 n=1 Tax=Scomber scombrus TaxID=13677 RepID=A0AAV1Q6B5_SCOSC
MQLHACLLLFIITTDKTLALSHHQCSGNVNLDQEAAGHINLTPPGPFTHTNRLDPVNHQTDETLPVSICTWMFDIPLGRTVLLKLVSLEIGSSISVRCVWNEEDQVLESGGIALLSGCYTNKATLTWTGTGHSSNAVQLSYYVQEDVRNSSEDQTSPHSDQDLVRWSQTGTSFTSAAPVDQEMVRGTEWGRGRLNEGLKWSSGPQSVSGPSSRDQGLLHPTSPLPGHTVAGRADMETLSLPEEAPNNRADTSVVAHLTDGPMSAKERTHPYLHTQHTLSTETLFHTENTETNSSDEPPKTQMAYTLTDSTASSSNTMLGTETRKYTQTSKHTDKHTTTQAHSTVSSSSVLPLTSSVPDLSPPTTRESDTILIPRSGAVSGSPVEKQPHAWRSLRSTDRLNSDMTSAITHDPSKSPQWDDSSSAHTDTESTASSESPSRTHSSTSHIPEFDAAVETVVAASSHPNSGQSDSFVSDVANQTAPFESTAEFDNTVKSQTLMSELDSASQTQTNAPQSKESFTHSPPHYTLSPLTQPSTADAQTATQRNAINAKITTIAVSSSSPDITKADDWISGFTDSSSTPRAPVTLGDVQDLAESGTNTLDTTQTLLNDSSPTHKSFAANSPTPAPVFPSSTSIHSPTPGLPLQTHTTFPNTPMPFSSTATESSVHSSFVNPETTPTPTQTSTKSTHTHQKHNNLPIPSSTIIPATHKQSHNYITTTHAALPSFTTENTDYEHRDGEVEVEKKDGSWQLSPSSTTAHTPTAGPPPQPPSWTTPHPSQESNFAHTPSASTSAPTWSSTTTQTPKFYIVPDQSAAITVESIELLLQIIVEESRSALTAGLEEDTAAWVEPYLLRASGFIRLLGVWSSGHAVQSLVEFKTSRALQWLSNKGPTSLLEQTGLAQAVREGRTFRSSKITNITLGGLQGDVCDWLLQCPAGYKCVSQPGTANYSCSSVCHFDHCHHHGICTHHPDQLPVCRCLVGEDFWYMGQRCDVRMTRARLVSACLAILLIMVTVIGVLAFAAVRRYRAILIQAKVDQTRSSYRRFNHFDELSGRFWLRSLPGSADSLDNPVFTRSDELLHLRALDRPCCYHDDTLSLASTCPSHGAHINTIYPHSSQYGWRGSEMSMGDGVLDSGKASDLSVCSWPVEPIQWTPFPLLQQLAAHRTPTVRVRRPRSYCEGMELVDMGKSWTA